MYRSVADPGCFIPDPNNFSSQILHKKRKEKTYLGYLWLVGTNFSSLNIRTIDKKNMMKMNDYLTK
jgi:hypothetical protein